MGPGGGGQGSHLRRAFIIRLGGRAAHALIRDPDGSVFEQDNDCLPALGLKHRVILFIIFNVVGYIMQVGGLAKLIEAFYSSEYKFFAIIYSLGKMRRKRANSQGTWWP